MSELRLILLAAGIVLIIGIYLYSRRVQSRSTARNSPRREPSYEIAPKRVDPAMKSSVASSPSPIFEQADLELPEELRPEPEELAGDDTRHGTRSASGREKVIVIHVSAKGGTRFSGRAIVDALEAESLEFGEFDIFHRRSGQKSLFSVASMVEPGKFDLDNIESLSTPGLSLFLVLPGPDSPVAAFTEMLSTARRLSTTLGGDVLDENGSTLSRQAASHLREQIIEFAHRIR